MVCRSGNQPRTLVTGPLTRDACFSDWRHAHQGTVKHTRDDPKAGAQAGQGHWIVGANMEADFSGGQSLPHDSHQVP